jgi:hypothetical protein
MGGAHDEPGTTTLPWIRRQFVQVRIVSGFRVPQWAQVQVLAIVSAWIP